MNNNKNFEQINQALSRLMELANVDVELVQSVNDVEEKFLADARVVLTINKTQYELFIETRSAVREVFNLRVRLLMKYFTTDNLHGVLLIANYFHPKVKEHLKKEHINYLELSGNCCIRLKGVFIFIEGQKPQRARVKVENRAVSASGLKVIIALLLNPDLLVSNYRAIATASNIALGGVGTIMKDLEAQGYVKVRNNKKCLLKRHELLERWAELYPLTLKRKQLVGRYMSTEEELRFNTSEEWYLSAIDEGEDLYKVKAYTFYTNVKKQDLRAKFGLVQDKNGEIEVLKPFWHPNNESMVDGKFVNVILNYVDRISHPTKRKLGAQDITDFRTQLKRTLIDEN